MFAQDKTREICTASCLVVVKGDSLKDQHIHWIDDSLIEKGQGF